MVLDRRQLKRDAKGIVKAAKVSAYGVTLLYVVLTFVLNGIETYMSGSTGEILAEWGIEVPFSFPTFPPLVVTFVSVVVWLICVLLDAGYVGYHLGVRRGERMEVSSLFDGLAIAGKLILLNIVIVIKVFLWSLLLVIPGIVASYRYRFAIYNMCNNPGIGVMEAIKMSKEQTNGFKWQLFVLDLSFIGWGFLCGLTLGILTIWVAPWMQQSDLGFYYAICDFKQINTSTSEDNGEFHPTEF